MRLPSFVRTAWPSLLPLCSALLGFGCGSSEEEAPPPPQTYAADHAELVYSGRFDFSDPLRPRVSAAGASVTARFRGTSATVLFDDEFRYGKWRNHYEIVLDGESIMKLSPVAPETRFTVATDLPNEEHTITLFKRTEANVGYTEFLGFELTGEILPAPARPARRIEVIGDSISVGSGADARDIEVEKCAEEEWGQPYHNAYLSYGARVGRALDAEVHITGVSGIGLVRNYSSQFDARTMPDVYDLEFVELTTSPVWDTTRFEPDAILVALGTNDFSPGDSEREQMDPPTYAEAYVAFLEQLRAHYPNAQIFGLSSPMLGDGWPDASYTSATSLKDALTMVEAHYADAGETWFHKLYVSKLSGAGCGTHPSAAQHGLIADEVAPAVAGALGW